MIRKAFAKAVKGTGRRRGGPVARVAAGTGRGESSRFRSGGRVVALYWATVVAFGIGFGFRLSGNQSECSGASNTNNGKNTNDNNENGNNSNTKNVSTDDDSEDIHEKRFLQCSSDSGFSLLGAGVPWRQVDEEDLVPHPYRVAGHPIYLEEKTNSLLKPLQSGVRGQRELNFYTTVYNQPILNGLVPKFYGVAVSNTGKLYLELEDLTSEFILPCILDIKIGRRTWGPDATPDKIRSALKKYKYQHELGFRICGMRRAEFALDHPLDISADKSHRPNSKPKTRNLHSFRTTPLPGDHIMPGMWYQYVVYPKAFGYSLRPKDLTRVGLREGFRPHQSSEESSWMIPHVDDAIIREVIARIRNIGAKLETRGDLWRLYSCSILIVYEGFSRQNLLSQNSTSSQTKLKDHQTLSLKTKPLNEHSSHHIHNHNYNHNDNKYQESTTTSGSEFKTPHRHSHSRPKVEVRLIDFAHAHPVGECSSGSGTQGNGCVDEDFLFGLDSLVCHLTELL